MKTPRELRDQRAGLKVEAQTLLDVAKKENRDLTVEERTKFDGLVAQVDTLQEDIRRAEKMDALNAEPQERSQNPVAEIGMTDKEIKRYSFMRAINASAKAAMFACARK